MSNLVQLKFDNSLDIDVIEKPLYQTSIDEDGYKDESFTMTKVDGILTPLIKFNNKIVEYMDIKYLKLECLDTLPRVILTILDSKGQSINMDTPGPDNTLVVQIIPKFDKIYKKINLRFYIDSIYSDTSQNIITIRGTYIVDKLMNSNLESFGKTNTLKFIEDVANRLKLGFCTNVTGTDDDRYIYMSSTSFLSAIENETKRGGNSTMILNSWIDWWNNLNLVDMYDMYKGEINTDLKVWVASTLNKTEGLTDVEPEELEATITNNPKMITSQLYSNSIIYKTDNGSNFIKGTDRVINIYDKSRDLLDSRLLQDGTSIKKDIYTKYYYEGEFNPVISNGNYLVQHHYIDMLNQKINNNIVEVELLNPCLALMRGHKVNLEWYDNNNTDKELREKGKEIESNIPLIDSSDVEDPDQPGYYTINRKISGQYVIIGTYIEYNAQHRTGGQKVDFKHKLLLSKNSESFNYSNI